MAIYNLHGEELIHAYNVSGEELDYAYNLSGERIFSRKPPGVDYDDWTLFGGDWCKVTLNALQGFEVYDNVIFQFRSNPDGTMTTIDKSTNQIIAQDIAAGTGHGNGAQFSDIFYSASDEFPLLYVVPLNTDYVHVNRVTRTTSELVSRYYCPRSSVGYVSGVCLDNANRIMYLLGYTMSDVYSDHDGTNKTVITKWDLNDVTDNGNNTFAPVLLDRYERDFIYCLQGTQYHDGMLWIASGSGTGAAGLTQYIYALDPATGEILHAIDFGIRTEIEGVTFISDTELIFNLQGGTYKKITFAKY